MATSDVREKECYWIPHPSKVYKMIMVKRIKGISCYATTTDDNISIDLDIPDCPFYPVNAASVDDMTALPHLHEAGILYNLQDRSQLHRQMPYTYVANVLIAVNPLRVVPDPNKEAYCDSSMTSNPPHPYGIAEFAFQQMTLPKALKRNQTIVIAGESGAGKTETVKIILRYLCWRSQQQHHRPHHTKTIDQVLLQSNPILESFGNAKTVRNCNASRFGKLLKLYFESANSNRLVSGGIETYLLEKSRIAMVSDDERNFHIFYQLLAGANMNLRKKWHLKSSENYNYLNYESSTDVDGLDDQADFVKLREALSYIGISNSDQDCIFRTVSAILSLGNVEFVASEAEGGYSEDMDNGDTNMNEKSSHSKLADPNHNDAAQIAQSYVVEKVADLLGLSKSALQQTLTEHVIDMKALNNSGKFSTRQESDIHTPRTVAQAFYARDSMAKAIYQRLFDWIVQRVRDSLHESEEDANASFIGVLDIFGFENFQLNSFEQLLINYANESLQNLYTKTVLESEHALYVQEGLNVSTSPKFTSNEGCLEVIATGKKSIISFLDSVCIRPGVEEGVFLSLLHTNIKKNPFFPTTKSLDKKEKFRVKHYARTVTYTVGSFISKNMDIKLSGLDELLESSSFFSSSKCTLFSGSRSRSDSGSSPDSISEVQNVVPQRRGSVGVSVQHRTVGATFVNQMARLSKLLESTSCSFVRCIKPNNTMTNGLFDPACVVNQLRCLGVVQTCEVLKMGLPTRIKISELEDMYRPFVPEKLYHQLHNLNQDRDSFILALLWACQIPADSYYIGKTKVFFKFGKISILSDLCQTDSSSDKAVRVISRLRLYRTRIYFRKWMSRFMCENALKALFNSSRKRLQAAHLIQTTWRSFFYSATHQRRKGLRRKWRIAILCVRCALVFMAEIRLVVEANEMRLAAQAKATEDLERHEARLQELIDKEEAEYREELEANMERRRTQSLGGEVDGDEENFSLALEEEDQFPASLDDFPRHRSHSTGRSNSVGRRGSAGGSSVAARNASIANFSGTSSASIAKTEMAALVAASSLATVSVCLFRWQNIKLFAAFETWINNIAHENDGDNCESDKSKPVITKRTGALRSSLSFDQRHSLLNLSNIMEADEDKEDTDEVSTPESTKRNDTIKDRDDGVTNDELKRNSHQLNRQSSIASKIFDNVGDDVEDESEIDGDINAHAGSSSMKSDKCYECMERLSVFYCQQCNEEYCKVCSLFVHDYCKHMKTHTVVDKNERPSRAEHLPTSASNEDRNSSVSPAAISDKSSMPQPQRRASRGGYKSMGMTSGEDGDKKNHCAIRSCEKPATKGVSIRFCDEHYEEFRSGMKISKQHESEEGETDFKTLQQQVALLTKQLQESGQQPVEFVELCVARERMQAAVERLMRGEEAAENDIERWDKAIKMNPDYQIEMEEKAKKWEEDQRPKNKECYIKMRKLIPPDFASASVGSMMEDGLPKSIANRIWSKKILGMICTHEADIKRIHIVDLQTKFSNQGLDIVEMRALWYVMPEEFDLDGDGKKAKWRDLFRQKLEELTTKEEGNRLSNMEKRHTAYKGHDDLEVYDPNTEIKRKVIAKSTAFSATEKPDINNKLGSGIKELRKQMAPEKPLIDGPLLYLCGGSDNPDDAKKIYANLFLQKRAILLYPNADKAKEGSPSDLIEEVLVDKEHTLKLGPGSKTFCLMKGDKEDKAFQSDKARREAWATSLQQVITQLNAAKKVKKKEKKAPDPEEASEERPPRPSFLDSIAKKGGERPPAPSFMDAIKNRKKAGEEAERPPAPSFMDAIKNRKKAGEEGERPPAPSFMDAIKNRRKKDEGEDSEPKKKPQPPSFLDAIAQRKAKEDGDESASGASAAPATKKTAKVGKQGDI